MARAAASPPEEAARQVELFRQPPPPTRLLRPCTRRRRHPRRSPEREHAAPGRRLRDAPAPPGRIGRFVPASGAATRMFKRAPRLSQPAGERRPTEVRRFFAELPRFAFFDGARARRRGERGIDLDGTLPPEARRAVADLLLDPDGASATPSCPRG